VAEVIDLLPGVHIVLDTSGFGTRGHFVSLARRADLVYFDLKVMDPVAHRRWTGQDNAPILRNLGLLASFDDHLWPACRSCRESPTPTPTSRDRCRGGIAADPGASRPPAVQPRGRREVRRLRANLPAGVR